MIIIFQRQLKEEFGLREPRHPRDGEPRSKEIIGAEGNLGHQEEIFGVRTVKALERTTFIVSKLKMIEN